MKGVNMQIKNDGRKGFRIFQPGFRRGLLGLIFLAAGLIFSTGCRISPGALFGKGDIDQTDTYELSVAQSDLLQDKGYPEGFIILFYEEEDLNGSLSKVRQETWNYYSSDESYLFINGDLINTEGLGYLLGDRLASQPYTPDQFSAGMDLEQVLAAAGVDTFIEVPLEKEYLEDGDLYYAESLSFGLVDGELRYLEALALIEE